MAPSLTPITIPEAKAFIARYHRRLPSRDSALFAVGVARDGQIVGVATVARPTVFHLDRRYTAEVTRLCVLEDVQNACSMLNAACWRAAKSLGYTRIITYTQADEKGTSLIAVGWTAQATATGNARHTECAPYLDYRPLAEDEPGFEVILERLECAWIGRAPEQTAQQYPASQVIPEHLGEVRKTRPDLTKTM